MALDAFLTRDHVPDFDDHVAWYRERSTQTRAKRENRRDLRYGDSAGATLDLFFPEDMRAPAPIHLFVHGGYWRMFDKSDFSFVADTVCAAGGIAAIMNYDLMPKVRMAAIVEQVRLCAAWLADNACTFGGDAERLSVSGHSAGAHLACFLLMKESPVAATSVLALSGIYDLEPLQRSFLQPELALTDTEVDRLSPLSLEFTRPARVILMAGAAETPPFRDQAALLERKLVSLGYDAKRETVPDTNHMTIVSSLADGQSIPGRALRTCLLTPH